MTNQKLDILSPSGTLIRQHVLSPFCTRKFSLMNEDSVTLHFWSREPLKFPIGSSVGDFFITQAHEGKWDASTGAWDYELKFDAYYLAWKNKLLRYIIPDVDSASETSFTLTATIGLHAQVILNCLNALGITYGDSPFRVDTTDESLSLEAKLVRYENLSILGGIQAIAEAFDCEWWVNENVIYFGRCENSDSKHVFEAGINTSSISFQQAKTEAPNRLYVYGSDRNLPTNYRHVDGNDTIGGVVARRLMLPQGIPYLQTKENIPDAEIVEQVEVLDSVYPRVDLTVSEEPETYSSTTEDNEENEVYETYYRLKYDPTFFFSESYVLPNEELHIIFQSGMLNGMEFGAKFNPKGLNEKNEDGSWNPEAQMIEVVVNEDYGRRLPDEFLKPQKGDKFILSGWDATKMEDLGLIADAEQELLEEGKKALEEYTKDLSSCTCPMAWDYMKPLFAENKQPKAGDIVTIIDTAHFGEGGRKSRIIGFEYKLDKPYAECIYTCGENVSVKRLDSIEKKIKGLAKSGTKVQIQNSLDFLSKRYSDRTPYKLSADQGFEAGNFLEGFTGARIDGQGNAEVASIKVREFAQFAELIVNRQTTIEGDQLYSEGDTIEEVIPNADGTYTLRLHAEWDGYTTGQFANNVCRGIYNDITKGSGFGGQGSGVTHLHNATYYTSWFRVLTVNPAANTIDVVLYADDEVPAGKNFPPMAMMKFARWGNSGAADNADFAMRQSVILISSTEGRIMQLVNVTKPIIDIGNVAFIQGKLPEIITDRDARLSPGEIALYVKTIVAQQNITMSHLMRPTPTLVFVGPYDPDGEYLAGDTYDEESGVYPRHIVENCGCQWVCSKSGTKQEPSYTSTDWTFYLGDKILHIDFQEIDSLVDLENPECPLTMEAWYMGQNVTDSIAIYYDWMRESWRNGKQDTASDALWNDAHKNAGPALVLDGADMNFQFGSAPEKLIFTVTAILNDPSNPKLKPSMAQYYMI